MNNNPSIDSFTSCDEKVLDIAQHLRLQYPTKADCFERLCELEGIEIECNTCGNRNIEREKGDRSFVCSCCRKTTWITAGSFFEHLRKIFPWLLLIQLRESGININSNRFSKLAGVASSTAQVMYKKISIVIESCMTDDMIPVPSKDFSRIYGKRSLQTPAEKHPIFEQFELEKSCLEKSHNLHSDITDRLDDVQIKVLEAISSEPIHIDSLGQLLQLPIEKITAALVMLELDELILALPGAKYVQNTHATDSVRMSSGKETPENLRKQINAVIDFITFEFHRVSRKYIQIYLSAIWSQLTVNLWRNGKLFQACLRYGKISKIQIREYVSPAVLKLWVPSTFR